jgi:hypothetical protein
VTLIQREYIQAMVASSQHHNGRVGQAEAQVCMTLNDANRGGHVYGTEVRQLVRAARDVS